jgi:hypothetical protein
MLAGATVDRLLAWRPRHSHLPFAGAPLAAFAVIAVWLDRRDLFVGWTAIAGAVATTAILCAVVLIRAVPRLRSRHAAIRFAPALFVGLAFVQPTGLELVDAATGSSIIRGWEATWNPTREQTEGNEVFMSTTDPGGAGEFLQKQLASGPFRYVGYGGLVYPGDRERARNYTRRRFEPPVLAILVNGRSIYLGLYETQGYNAMQLQRYMAFTLAMNRGVTQDYHHANVRPAGVDSPLLNLLNVRYLLVDASLPEDRDDMVALATNRTEVFRNDLVVVYENPAALSPAWIVHDVMAASTPAEALNLITQPGFDPTQRAIVEGDAPAVAPPQGGAPETAQVTTYEPDRIVIRTQSSAPGLLVVSEMYAGGWNASIDGDQSPILATNQLLRGIPLPAGEHEVVLTYAPRSLRVGLLLSGVSTAAMLVSFGLVVWAPLRRRWRTR